MLYSKRLAAAAALALALFSPDVTAAKNVTAATSVTNLAPACQQPTQMCIYATKGVNITLDAGKAQPLPMTDTGVHIYVLDTATGARGSAHGCNASRAFFNMHPGDGSQGTKILDVSGQNNNNIAGFFVDNPGKVATHGTVESQSPSADLFLYCYDQDVDGKKNGAADVADAGVEEEGNGDDDE